MLSEFKFTANIRDYEMNKPFSANMMMIGMLLFSCSGCETSESSPASEDVAPVADGLAVEHYGAMREVMREGKTEARVRLVDVVAKPHAYAVGALEGLAGEVTIVNGEVWISRVSPDGELTVTGPEPVEDDSATLLTVGYVPKWHQTTIETAVTGLEFEALIEEFAESKGLDRTRPFPFRLEGQLAKIDLHVINGYCPIATDASVQEKKPWRWLNSDPVTANIVGFYAPNAVAVMTHHGTSVHTHAIVMVNDAKQIGHVDNVIVEPGMTLFVPEL